MQVFLTKHAEDRLITRTGLSIEDFGKIYGDNKILLIGNEVGSNRCHELFHSKPANQCFVSIRDNKNSEIITILPIDYHENIAWKISQDAQIIAKNLINGEKRVQISEANIEHKKSPSKFRVVAIDRVNFKRKNITSFNCEDFSYDIDLLLSNPSLEDVVVNFFKENNKNIFSEIEIIFGSKRNETRLVSSFDFF